MLISILSTSFIIKQILRFLYRFTLKNTEIANTEEATNKMSNFSKSPRDITSNTITFKPSEKQQSFEIGNRDVTIFGSAGKHDHGSSKVKLTNIVDYKWETKNYPGHLIAVHIDGKHIAYVINVNNRVSGTEGMVRVANAQSGQRALIKGMTGEVLDLQFAHIADERILACIDIYSLFIYKIETISDALVCNFLLKVYDPLDKYTPKFDRITWCPFVPDNSDGFSNDNDDETSQLIVWARGNIFQCFNVQAIRSKNLGKVIQVDDIKSTSGYLGYCNKLTLITWIVLSPDGTTLGVASDDGIIRFHQIYFYEKEPRCLHQWKPHDGKQVSSFFFLDNLTQSSHEAYWKYALTCAENNTEIKIWDCGKWECLQTISLKTIDNQSVRFIAEIDRTSSYLVLTNIETRSLYVIQIDYELTQNLSTDKEKKSKNGATDTRPIIRSVSEFPLSSSILSFSIIDAAVRKYKCALNESYLLDELENYDEETNSIYCAVIHMFIVQPKSVQECHILYQPKIEEALDVKRSLSFDSKECLTDTESISAKSNSSNDEKVVGTNAEPSKPILSIEMAKQLVNLIPLVDKPASNPPSPPISTTSSHKSFTQVNLMTPDSFNTSGKKTPEAVSSDVLSTILMLAKTNSSISKPDNLNFLNLVNSKIIEDQQHSIELEKKFTSLNKTNPHTVADNLTSGGSSPSREVREIMSVCDDDDGTHSDGTDKKLTSVDWPDMPEVQNISVNENDPPTVSTLIQQHNMELSNINKNMTKLLHVVNLQTSQIKHLQEEITEIRNSKLNSATHLIDLTYNLENSITKHLEQKFSAIISSNDAKLNEMRENIIKTLNQIVLVKLSEDVSTIVDKEIQGTIIPVLFDKLEDIQDEIQKDIGVRLSASEQILKDNISQVSKSKAIMDGFSKSVLTGMKDSLQSSFVQSVSTLLVPAYEKSSQVMFKQLQDAFNLGINKFIEQFDAYLIQMEVAQNNSDHLIHSFTNLKSHLITNILETKKDFKDLELHLSDLLRTEIRKSFETQAASLEDSVLSAVRSQAQTPSPSIYDVQDQIKHLLAQGQINKAFHQALLANDLSLVEFTLVKADYNNVFNPCCLEQTVLLSLIQQISADMNNHSDIKQKYLSDGILNLNQNDIITKEHAPKVMNELYRNCQSFLVTHPKSSLCSNVRMIMMAIQGMGYKIH